MSKPLNRIFWVGCFSPRGHNIGDHAQTLALQKFLENKFSDYEIKRYYRTEVNKFFNEQVRKDDLIFIHSSGDFGDRYGGWHDIRKKIVDSYPNNRVVQLPINVDYLNPTNFEVDKIFFADRPNLLVLCRTYEDAELLKNNFNCATEFFPDFAFYLKPKPSHKKRKGILAIFREDFEGVFCLDIPKKLFRRPFRRLIAFINRLFVRKQVKRFCGKMSARDIQISDVDVTDENREQIVYRCLRLYESYEKVITDRFHACVFSYLTDTPFIAFNGKINHKVNLNLWLNYSFYFNNFRKMVFSHNSYVEQPESNDVYDVIKARRSIRKWNSKPVELHKIKKMLEAAVYAPSASNLQATRFKVLTSKEEIDFVCQNTSPWFKGSHPKVAILVFYDKSTRITKIWQPRFIWQDTACAMQNMMLIAHSLKLTSCWATVNPQQTKQIISHFNIPKNLVLTCMLFFGYSNITPLLDSTHQSRKLTRSLDKAIIP